MQVIRVQKNINHFKKCLITTINIIGVVFIYISVGYFVYSVLYYY